MESDKLILDACCGSRMFWFDKHNPLVLFVDKRSETLTAKDKDRIRTIDVKPDVIADFTNLPFEDNSFYMVVFDPPHLKTLGETSWMAKKYGKLPKDWKSLIHDGFAECMRVLKPNGTLIFKWNESEIKASEVLSVIPFKPLFGHTTGRQSKTIWMCFMKREDEINNTEEKHCSICVHYEICANFQMYCHALKRRITARKQAKNCKYFEYRWRNK